MSHPRTSLQAARAVALVLAVSACGGTSAPEADAPVPAADSVAEHAAADMQAAEVAGDAAGGAHPGYAMPGPMPALGGGMQALAEHCGGDAGELASLKQQQRELAIQSGMSGAQFDAEYAKGYDDTAARIRQGTPAEREQACAQVREMEEFGRQMEQRQAAGQR